MHVSVINWPHVHVADWTFFALYSYVVCSSNISHRKSTIKKYRLKIIHFSYKNYLNDITKIIYSKQFERN